MTSILHLLHGQVSTVREDPVQRGVNPFLRVDNGLVLSVGFYTTVGSGMQVPYQCEHAGCGEQGHRQSLSFGTQVVMSLKNSDL